MNLNAQENNEVRVEINEEFIQDEAEQEIDRPLNREELEAVEEGLRENLWEYVRDAISRVISYSELIENNKNAGKTFPHYQVYWRNIGAFQPQFKELQAFRTEKEAVEYTQGNKIGNSENEWKIVKVNSPEDLSTEKPQL